MHTTNDVQNKENWNANTYKVGNTEVKYTGIMAHFNFKNYKWLTI